MNDEMKNGKGEVWTGEEGEQRKGGGNRDEIIHGHPTPPSNEHDRPAVQCDPETSGVGGSCIAGVCGL
jgi:hypothetical protein